MSASPEGTVFQANFKTPAGALLNVYAQNGAEFVELLDAFESFIPKIAAVEGLLGGASVVARPTQQPVQATAAAAPVAPVATGGPVCNCGNPAKLVPAGVAKATGRPYNAFYACASPRGSQCDFRAQA